MLQRRDTRVTRHTGGWIVLGAGLLTVCLLHAGSRAKPVATQERLQRQQDTSRFPKLSIDINTAGVAELGCIPGIGPALAERIIHFREEHGGFSCLADLRRVPGVGPQLAAQLSRAISPLPTSADELPPLVQSTDFREQSTQLSMDALLHDQP